MEGGDYMVHKKEYKTDMSQALLYGIVGALIGGGVVLLIASNAVTTGNTSMMRMMGMGRHIQSMDEHHGEDHMKEVEETEHLRSMDGMMESMRSSLNGLTGDDFDKAFLTGMIVHHQGAIDMAKEATKSAKHEEIKNLANDIINAQTIEIGQMKLWQKEWGY
jgi:hypothetical protein